MTQEPQPRARSGAAYLAVVVLVYVAARLAAALFFVLAIRFGPEGDGWNRIANVRSLPEGTQNAVLQSFLAREKERHDRSGRKSAILVAGDSQLYGYYLPAPRTMAARLADELPWATVHNASRLSAGYDWTQAALEAAIEEGLAPRVLVRNANPAIRSESPRTSRHLFAALVRSGDTLGMAVDVLRARLRKGALPYDPYDVLSVPPGDGSFQVASLDRDYYPAQLPANMAQSLRALLEYSRGKVELVVIVASPHYYAPYNEAPFRYGWDTAPAVRESMAICAEFAHAACLDLSTAFGREYFHDVVHLNEAGQRALAARVAAVIRSRLPAAAGQ